MHNIAITFIPLNKVNVDIKMTFAALLFIWVFTKPGLWTGLDCGLDYGLMII